MRCPRCGRLMAGEPRGEIDYDADVPWRQDGWRCLNCGAYFDMVILENRALVPRCAHP